MRGKLMICTKCGQDSQNHEEGCDCKKAMKKLSFSYDKIWSKNHHLFFNQIDQWNIDEKSCNMWIL